MVRKVSAALLLLVVLAAGAAAWGVHFLFYTPAGAAWLIGAVSRHTSMSLSAAGRRGTLAGGLDLEGVGIGMPGAAAGAGSVRLRVRPAELLEGRLGIDYLAIRGVDVRVAKTPEEKKPSPAEGFRWPRIRGTAARIEVRIGSLSLTDLTYRQEGREPVRVFSAAARVDWRGGTLDVRDLSVDAAGARAVGRLSAGLSRPSLGLALGLSLAPGKGPGGMDRFQAAAALESAGKDDALSGPFTLRAISGQSPRLDASGRLRLSHDRAALEELRLTFPGRQGVVTGRAGTSLAPAGSSFSLDVSLAGLDLAKEAGVRTDLSGRLHAAGSPDSFRGRIALANKGAGWRAASFSGDFSGSRTGVRSPDLSGAWAGGTLRGGVDLSWDKGMALAASLRGRSIDPARIDPSWPGTINFDADATARRDRGGALTARVKGRLGESLLRNRPFRGEVDAAYRGGDVEIASLSLRGAGFDAAASGRLAGRINVSLSLADLSGFVPDTAGRLQARGWVARRGGLLGGAVTARGSDLRVRDLRADSLAFSADRTFDKGGRFAVDASAKGIAYRFVQVETLQVVASGTAAAHEASLSALWRGHGRMKATLAGGYGDRGWKGRIESLSGSAAGHGGWRLEEPVEVAASAGSLSFSHVLVTTERGGTLTATGSLRRAPLRGSFGAAWKDIDLAYANPLLEGITLAGGTSGTLGGRIEESGRLGLSVRAEAAGKATYGELVLSVSRAAADLAWGAQGLQAKWDLRLAGGGEFTGSVVSREPARLEVPSSGDFHVAWDSFDVGVLRPWMPESVSLDGQLSGRIDGVLLPGSRFRLGGDARVAKGDLRWETGNGEVGAKLRDTGLRIDWSGESVRAGVTLVLEGYGSARGRFALPAPARLPVVFDRTGPIRVAAEGELEERGLLPALFPGLVQDSGGKVSLSVSAGGTWNKPDLGGTASLEGAGAYFPAAGIRLTDVSARARLSGERVIIETVRARSGPGSLQARGEVLLAGWHASGYRLALSGDRFQAVNLPELQVQTSPDLTVEGTKALLSVRGDVRLPDVLVRGRQGPPVVKPSSDVIIVDAPPTRERRFPLALDVRVNVVLGDNVRVNEGGLNALMRGSVTVVAKGLRDVTGTGQIVVAKGTYSLRSVHLDITRGVLAFSGGAVSQPSLDILALRTIGGGKKGGGGPSPGESLSPNVQAPTLGGGTAPGGGTSSGVPPSAVPPPAGTPPGLSAQVVRAGVRITGTPRVPVVALYSEPSMPDADVLSYIVLGRPLGVGTQSRQDAASLSAAANVLLTQGPTGSLQESLSRRLGIDVLSVGAGTVGTDNTAGTVLTVGKYLNPNLYVSYGRSLFTGTSEVGLRYDFLRHFEVQSRMGQASGVDLFYRIDFR